MSERVYAFVRKDISLADQMVQLGHSCLLSGSSYGSRNETKLVLCEVKDTDHLFVIADILYEKDIRFEIFYEPGNAAGEILEWTSLTTQPIKYKLESDHIKLWTNKDLSSRIEGLVKELISRYLKLKIKKKFQQLKRKIKRILSERFRSQKDS